MHADRLSERSLHSENDYLLLNHFLHRPENVTDAVA